MSILKDKPYDDVSRMYSINHADHESGYACLHVDILITSLLSGVYYDTLVIIKGLAGLLHGGANQEVLRWLQGFMNQMGGEAPAEEKMKKYRWNKK